MDPAHVDLSVDYSCDTDVGGDSHGEDATSMEVCSRCITAESFVLRVETPVATCKLMATIYSAYTCAGCVRPHRYHRPSSRVVWPSIPRTTSLGISLECTSTHLNACDRYRKYCSNNIPWGIWSNLRGMIPPIQSTKQTPAV